MKNKLEEMEYAQNIVETMREPLLVLDDDLHVLSANGSFYRTFRVTPEETIGNFIYDLGNRQWDIPQLRRLLDEILPENTVFNDYEVDHFFQRIGHKIILLNARQIFRKDVGSHIILLAMEDITDRRQAELSLTERNKELICLYNVISLLALPDISLDEMCKKTALFLQDAFQFPQNTGVSINMQGHSAQTPLFRETPWLLSAEIVVQGKPVGQIMACLLEEHQARHAEQFLPEELALLCAIGGKLGLYFERRDSKAQLYKLTHAIEQSSVAIEITDLHGTIEYANSKLCEITGYSIDELIGQNPRILKSDITPTETYKQLWSALTSGKTWHGEFCNIRKDGSTYWERAVISPFSDSTDGSFTHYMAVKEDITEQKMIREQLIHAQKVESIGELAGGLAHDLNNILSVVNGYATLLQNEIDPDLKSYSHTEKILAASQQAGALTHSLLAYSRKQPMHQIKQDLNALMRSVGGFIKRVIRENISFTIALQDEALGVSVDKNHIEQVMINLATNARDAMPDGGELTIATSSVLFNKKNPSRHPHGKPGSYAVITVTDTGLGMDETTRQRIFDPFFTTKEVGKGTGLGMSMVIGIITQHGGFIEVDSTPGSGTVFRLYLPLIDMCGCISEPARPAAGVLAKKESGTILVVEDDVLTRTSMEEILKRVGYTVIVAGDGVEAVEKFAAHKDEIQLVISDVVMPRKSGKALHDEIQTMCGTTRFIFVSGHSMADLHDESIEDVRLLMKPIDPRKLLSTIKEIM